MEPSAQRLLYLPSSSLKLQKKPQKTKLKCTLEVHSDIRLKLSVIKTSSLVLMDIMGKTVSALDVLNCLTVIYMHEDISYLVK